MYSPTQTLQKVKHTLSRHRMISEGLCHCRCSGGPDSVCLLHVLHELKTELNIHLFVAHFDHGLRPAEERIRNRLCSGSGQSLKLPFETAQGHLLCKKARGSGRSGEETHAMLSLRE